MESKPTFRVNITQNEISDNRINQPSSSNGSSSTFRLTPKVEIVENGEPKPPIVRQQVPIVLDDDDTAELRQNARIKFLEKQLENVKTSNTLQIDGMKGQIDMVLQLLNQKNGVESTPSVSSSPAQSVSSPLPAMDVDEMSDEQIMEQKRMLEAILAKRKLSRKSQMTDEDLFVARVVEGSFQGPTKRKASNEPVMSMMMPLTKSPKIVSDNPAFGSTSGGAEPMVNVQCSTCSLHFKKISHLLNHRLETHGKEVMLQCGKCRMKFNTRVEIQRHLYIEYAVFDCKKCSACLPNSNQLQLHEQTCKAKPPQSPVLQRTTLPTTTTTTAKLECNLCSVGLDNVDDLLTHRQVYHGMKIMLKCPKCNLDFLSKPVMKRHLNVEYMMYPCKNCGSCLESEEDLIDHETLCLLQNEMVPIVLDSEESPMDVTVNNDSADMSNPLFLLSKIGEGYLDSTPTNSSTTALQLAMNSLKRKATFETEVTPIKQCSKCNRIVSTINDLLNHREIEHGIETMLVCGKCGQMFETREEIERHLNIEYRVFACVGCGLQTPSEVSLTTHEKMCISKRNGRTISCWTCNDGVKFSSVTDLMGHRLGKHGKDATRECGYCDKKFETRNGIHQHLTTVEYECFKCDRCQRLMLTQGKLDEHLQECTKVAMKQRARTLDPGFKCSKCEHSTMLPEVLEAHEPKCRGRNIIPMQCNICQTVFESVKALLTHRKDTHGENAMMECGICGRVCSRRDAIALHLNIEYRVFTCLRCDKPYQTLAQVFDHEKVCNGGQYHKQHQQNDDSMLANTAALISCPKCMRQSASQDIIDEHLKSCIGDSDWMPQLECNICNEPFQVLNDLLTHRQKVHGTATMYTCFKCPKQFESRKGIYGHLTLELGLLPCLKCLRNFSSITILTNHERICGGINGGYIERGGGQSANRQTAASRLVHQCGKCGNRSGSQFIIEEHEKDCNGEGGQLDITCSMCYDKFNTVSDLQQHRGRMHGEESVLQCGVCNKVFESKHGISAHLTMEYNLIPCLKCGKPQGGAPQLLEHEKNCAKNINNAMNCSKCNRLSFNKEVLDPHEEKCDGTVPKCEKEIQCAICDEQFTNVNSLLTHLMRTHSEEAMLTCGICGRQFESKNGIWGHLNSEYEIFPCLKCGKFQNSSSRLAEHERFCISGSSAPERSGGGNGGGNAGMSGLDMERAALQCSKCMKTSYLTTYSRATFAVHEASCKGNEEPLDPTGRKDIMCLVCNEAYFSVGDLVTHRQRNHGEATGLECHFCGRRFESRSGIVGHLSVEYELYPCSKCGKYQSSNSRRNDHEKNCNEDTMQTVALSQCSKCQKYGHRRDEVAKHEEACGTVESVENEKEIACIHCDHKFLNVPSLVGHNQTNHGDDAMLTCNVCGRKFESRQGVLMHLLLEYSNFICSKCGKSQINDNKLKEHENQCTFLKTLTCSQCEVVTFSDALLEKHECGEKETNKVVCSLCNDLKFVSVNDFLTHRNQAHGGEAAMLRCTFCTKKFTSKSGISWHYISEFALYPCKKCSKRCRSEQAQIEHEIKCNGVPVDGNDSFRKTEQTVQTCSKCGLKTFTASVFNQHDLICNGSIEKNIECILCAEEKFMTVNDFLTHRQNVHGDEAALKCQFCDRKFGSKNGVTGHMACEFGYMECSKCNLHHYSNARLEEHVKGCNVVFQESATSCKKCGKHGYIDATMKAHEVNCSESDTIFKCGKCSVELISVQDLLEHKLKEHGENEMLECGICAKKFASRTGIYWHYNKEYKVFRCKKCGKPQSSANLLTDHEKNCGNTKTEKEDTKTMEQYIMNCPSCGIASYYKNLMDIHKEECDGTSAVLTEGGREIQCATCDEKYLTINDLVHHRGKQHGDAAQLECCFCAKKYESKTGIIQHYMHEFHMYPCRICKATMASKKRRVEHEKGCKNEEIKEKEKMLPEMISCSKCSKSTFLQSLMDEHVKECGVVVEEEEVETTMETDESTMDSTTSSTSQPCPEIKCNLCSIACLSANDLLNHRNKEHGEQAMLTCVVCEKLYESRTGIARHYNLEFQQFSCKTCLKMFSHMSSLKRHTKLCAKLPANGSFVTATTSKEVATPSQCSTCSKWALAAKTIHEHTPYCGQPVDGKPLVCTLCDTEWLLPYELLTHRKEQHGVAAMTQCCRCEKKFENRDHTLKHVYVCYELYKCQYCAKVMQSPSKLALHLEKCAPPPPLPTVSRRRESQKTARFAAATAAELEVEEEVIDAEKYDDNEEKHVEKECEKCQLISLDSAQLARHEKECAGPNDWHDDDNRTITCTQCNKKFLTVPDLLSHHKQEHGENLSDCHFCGKRIDSQPGILAHFNIEYKLYECTKCDRACASKKRRDIHELSCNVKNASSLRPKDDPLLSNDDDSYTCVKCDRRSYSARSLKEHRIGCLGAGKYDGPKIDCKKTCETKFLTVNDLLQHRQKVHGDEEMLICVKCGKKSADRNAIFCHMVMEYRLFECPKCERCFENSIKLDDHKTRCQKVFMELKKDETDDFVVVASPPPPKLLGDAYMSCSKCGRSTTNATTLKDHTELCRGENEVVVKVDCWDCNAKFISVHDLVRHRSDAHPDKVLICKFCTRTFNSKSSILGHLVCEFKVFQCSTCARTFDCQKRLALHYTKCS